MDLDNKLCSHYLNPDFSESFLSTQDQQIYINLPQPIHKPFRNQDADIIRKYNEEISLQNERLLELSKEFASVKDRVMQQNFDKTLVNIPKGIIDFYKQGKRKLKQPFICDYNPYYTTGLLEHFSIYNADYLIRPDADCTLRVTKVSKPAKRRKLKVEGTLSDITGLSTALQHNCNVCLLLQHHNEVNLLHLTDIDEARVTWSKKFKREVISSKCFYSYVGAVLSNLKFGLYDIETNTKVQIKKNEDKVIRFDFIDNNNIVFLSEKSLKIFDRRSNEYRLYQPALDNCSFLSSLKFDDNSFYLGATHQLFKSDVRFPNFEFCTHMMQSSPCYMDFVQTHSNKYLCLSGQSFREKVLFYGIDSLPLFVPSLNDTLSECRLQKDVLLKKHLDERLLKSTGGIKLLPENDGACLYTTNCLGEIFKQQISNQIQDNGDAIESLYNWINQLPEPSKKLYLTDVANLSDARFALNKPIDDEALHLFTRKSGRKLTKFLNRSNAIYNTSDLGDLAANFASIWEEQDQNDNGNVNLMPEVEPIDKVNKWIESNYFSMED